MSTAKQKNDQKDVFAILAYTDGSEQSIDAVRSSIRFAKATGGILHILHVTEAPFETELGEETTRVGEAIPRQTWTDLPSGMKHLLFDVITWLTAEGLCSIPDAVEVRHQGTTLRRIVLDNCKIPIRLWLSYAEPAEALSLVVKEQEIDLAVIRGEETSLLKRFLGHNLAESVALTLPTNILVIRSAIYPDTPFIIGTNGSESANRAFGLMRRLIPMIETPVDIATRKDVDLTKLTEWLECHKKMGKIIYLSEENDASPINDILEKLPKRCVFVVGASMRSFLLKAFTGSLPIALVRAAPFSVLISKELPDKADQEV